MPDLEQLYLDAIKHPIRREIFRFASEQDGPFSPVRASKALEVDLSSVSYHVGVLADHCLLEPAFTRPVRGATEHFYTVNQSALEHPIVKAWMGQ